MMLYLESGSSVQNQSGIAFTPYDRKKFYNVIEEDRYTTWQFSKEFKAAQTSKL